MKARHLTTAMLILLGTGLSWAAPGPDELLMSRSAQVLGSGGSGRYQLEVTVRLEAGTTVSAGLTALAVEEVLPAGWVYESVDATPAPSTVNAVAGNTYQFVWVTLPDLSTPFEFTYLLNYPSAAAGQAIVGKAPYRTGGGQLESPTVTTPQNSMPCLQMGRSVAGYNPGQNVTVEVTLESLCGEPVTALAVEESWPPGWSFVSATGVGSENQSLAPVPGTEGTFQFIWFSPIPSFPFTFTYTVAAPVSATGPVTMTGQSVARLSGPELRTPLLDSVLERLDTTAPVITVNGSNPATVECGGSYSDAGATATDNVDGTVNVSSSGTVNPLVPASYTITYSATDSAGNTGTATRTVHVVDTVAPTLTLVGAALVTVECHTGYGESGALASDICAGNLTASIVITGTVDVNTPADYTRTYSVTDPKGNTATAIRTVRVVDTTAPTLTLNGGTSVSISCLEPYIEPGYSAVDSCAGGLNAAVQVSGAVNSSIPGSYTVVYSVSDPSGNAAAPQSRTVTVTDAVAPVITLNGPSTLNLTCGELYTEQGASALDACAGDLSGAVSVSGVVDTAVPGDYTVTYAVSDPSGNAAVPATRTVQVTDSVAPVIELVGAASQTMECGGTFIDPGANASDACWGDVTESVSVQGSVDPGTVGTYTLTYSAQDGSGNAAMPVTRTVSVADTSAPVLTLEGTNPLMLDCGEAFVEPGAVALDACEGTVAVTDDAGEINTNFPASYDITYTATDSRGNTATAVRTVVVGGPNCNYCPMSDIMILHPADEVFIPDNVPVAAILFSSEVLFENSADCMEGTIQVYYTVNGTEYVPSTDRLNNFPITLLLAPGQYTMEARAVLVETGQVIFKEKVFSVTSVSVGGNGYPLDPFTVLYGEGTSFSNTIQTGGYDRTIEMIAALCPADGGLADDIAVTVHYGGDTTRTLVVTVPRAVIPCGSQALVTVTVSDTIEGLVGAADTPYFVPVPGGFIAGGLFFDVSILVASLSDIAAGEPVPYVEVDNAAVAAHPISFSLSGLSFSPNLIPVFLSHESGFGPDGVNDLNLFGETADWSEDGTMGFLVEGNTLHGQASSLSVFAPFEKEKVLTFSPDIEYGVIFGLAVIGTGIDQVFTVTNNGELRASGEATIAGAEGVFSLVGTGGYSLAPGESFQLTVRFSPLETKDYEAILNFSGVPNTDLSVRVLGTGTLGPRKKCLSFLACAPTERRGRSGDLLVLSVALGMLAVGRQMSAGRRQS